MQAQKWIALLGWKYARKKFGNSSIGIQRMSSKESVFERGMIINCCLRILIKERESGPNHAMSR